ncbi:small RNA degrading nuclease 3-like isoform X2 [Lycium ferocissimum]|uniref:small RNA degrading nuclease 3-like isoform X2 n=1 Tax=Lycium ferocissimum TaxID=112874 RepID=UPI002815580F|nr:small RNA degrading nuclease 3-like isoform X2 [Lycium ferocissimum]
MHVMIPCGKFLVHFSLALVVIVHPGINYVALESFICIIGSSTVKLNLSCYNIHPWVQGWFVTGRSEKSNFIHSKAMVAVDCEMVLCQDHTEALVRICAVDRNLEVKLDEFVNPDKPIADYRTEITGITAEDLDGVTCSLVDVQMSMKKLLSHGTILIGHSLHHDLCALKLDHARVIDISYVFKYRDQPSYRRPSLNSLSKSVLGFELRKKDSPHNCLDDACTAMKLVLAIVELGADNIIPLVHEESEMAKLLVHRIPVAVSSQDLHKFIPGDYTVEINANKKAQADKYSAFANFKNQQEANEAFDKLEGNLEKDTGGRFQKLVSFHLDSSISGVLSVVKMTANNYSREFPVPMKRLLEDDKGVGEPKKLWTENHCTELKEATSAGCNHCETHLKEIEGLKKELSRRDEKISNLNKLIVNLEKTRIEKVRD